MVKKCPNCGAELSYLEVSRQIEGTRKLDGLQEIEWNSDHNQEPIVHNCPECLSEIPEEPLEEWGLA